MNMSLSRATRALGSFIRCTAIVGALWSGEALALGAGANPQAVQSTVNSDAFRTAYVQTVYQKLLDRSATPDEVAPLVAQMKGGGKAWVTVVSMVAGTPDYFQKAGNNNATFVNQLFQDLVARAPDPTDEASAATDFLKGGGSRSELADVVDDTDEFRANWTQTFYQKLLGRAATTAEVTAGSAKLNTGGISSLVTFLLASSEYFQKGGNTQSGWKNNVNQTLLADTAPDGGGGTFNGDINNGGTGGTGDTGGNGGFGDTGFPPANGGGGMPVNNSRAPMVQALLASPEYFSSVVQSTYQKYLRRAATPAELQQWSGALQGGGTSDQVLMSVLTSDEYFNRAGGTTTGYLNRLSQDLLGKAGGTSGKGNRPTTDDLLDMLRNLPHKKK